MNPAGGSGSDAGRAIAIDPTGNALLTGSFRGQATFGGVATITSLDDPPNLVNEPDIFIAKYDSGGNFDWVTRAGNAADDYGNGIASDSAGNVFVTGSVFHIRFCESCGSTIPLDDPHEDIFIAKYDPLGNLQWSKEVGGDGFYQTGRGIATDTVGDILIAGAFWDQAVFGEAPNEVTLSAEGAGDVFVAKYDTTGALTWVQQAGAAGTEQAIAVTVNDDQRIVVVGQFQQDATFGEDPDAVTITSEGSDDVFAAKYDEDGALTTYW